MPADASILLLSGLLVVLAVLLARQHLRIRERAEAMYERWRTRELDRVRADLSRSLGLAAEARLERWKLEHEGRIREDSVRRSQAVVAGKTTEHLLPFFPEFPFSPKDARFLGSPVDLVVFDGMSEGRLRDVIFVEVKTGASAGLTTRERRIRDAIEAGRVRFQEIRVSGPEAGPLPTPGSLYLPLRSPEGEARGQLELRLDAGEVRYWSDWSLPPDVYPLSPDVVLPLDGRRSALRLHSQGATSVSRLAPEAILEVDPGAGRMTLRSRIYDLESDRLKRRKGTLVLELDGGR
jgi:predicted Holliday junction resolvase-like endonuclease